MGFEPTQPTKPKEDNRAVSTAIGVGQKTKQHLLLLFKKLTQSDNPILPHPDYNDLDTR